MPPPREGHASEDGVHSRRSGRGLSAAGGSEGGAGRLAGGSSGGGADGSEGGGR